jgi:transposase
VPAKPSGEVKIRTIKNARKNGDVYILERQTLYDPVKKQTKIISSRLVSKIPKGTETPVQTRPKKVYCEKSRNSSGQISASRVRIGMMDMLSHIGAASGIDEGVHGGTDIGTAQKIISIARYLLASNGQTLPGILTWQLNHPLPYESGITEDVYHDLFVKIGQDETLQQNFFANRCSTIKDKAILAYDSTTVSTYSENQIEARYGYNKDDDGLKTIKYLALYSIETRQPVAFTKQPGNLPDVITIENALKQLSALGLSHAEIVTDNGYHSEHNLAEFFIAGFDFITLVKTSLKWVKAEIDAQADSFESIATACPFDTATHGITVMRMRDYVKVRKYANHKSGTHKGDEEMFRRRTYLHLYFNAARKAEQDNAFDEDLFALRKQVLEGANINELSKAAQNKVDKYLRISRRAGDIRITFDDAACRAAKKYHGYFALASNNEKNTFECLRKYRKRETIESFFESMKRCADGSRLRVWGADTLRGRMFVQFVALCYYEYLSNEIRIMKSVLGQKNGDPKHDTAKNLRLEKKLKTWLENTPIYGVLQWFDTIEGVRVSSALMAKRWSTEVTERDSLFLMRLGVDSQN